MFIASQAELHPDYVLLERQLRSLLEAESDFISNAAQFSAFIFESIADINWAGFYLLTASKKSTAAAPIQELLVGPFQGKVACARIPLGKGVCGTSAAERRTILVEDVHAFPGHIACDSASNSEIVIPLIKAGKLVGVFDIDSPSLKRFRPEDQVGLELLVGTFLEMTQAN